MRRARRIAALTVLTGAVVAPVAACSPYEVDVFNTLRPDEQGAVVHELQRRSETATTWGPAVCVRHHESDRGSWPYDDGYRAENPTSSASGAYQFIDSTWRSMSAAAGQAGYARASDAPVSVQDAVFIHVWSTGGQSHWRGSGC